MKTIQTDSDLQQFSSGLAKRVVMFVRGIGVWYKSIDESFSAEKNRSQLLDAVYQLLESLGERLVQTPPLEQTFRFGNKAYRTFNDKAIALYSQLASHLQNELGLSDEEREEMLGYLSSSFGNAVRIDFGTGHELCFVLFLMSLHDRMNHVGLAPSESTFSCETSLSILPEYLKLMRRVITQYNMEPAGSHGSWGVDDYFYLPFVAGSLQIAAHPSYAHDAPIDILQDYRAMEGWSLFAQGLAHLMKTKFGAPFHDLAPTLYEVLSTSRTWETVGQRMLRLYEVDVLGKRPAVQHIRFGPILRW